MWFVFILYSLSEYLLLVQEFDYSVDEPDEILQPLKTVEYDIYSLYNAIEPSIMPIIAALTIEENKISKSYTSGDNTISISNTIGVGDDSIKKDSDCNTIVSDNGDFVSTPSNGFIIEENCNDDLFEIDGIDNVAINDDVVESDDSDFELGSDDCVGLNYNISKSSYFDTMQFINNIENKDGDIDLFLDGLDDDLSLDLIFYGTLQADIDDEPFSDFFLNQKSDVLKADMNSLMHSCYSSFFLKTDMESDSNSDGINIELLNL